MELIDRQAALDALDEITEIKGYAYTLMEEALQAIPTEAVVRDCTDCFGASFGDCDNCDKIALSVRSKIGDKLSDTVEKIDAYLDTLPERIKHDFGIVEKYKARRYSNETLKDRMRKLLEVFK